MQLKKKKLVSKWMKSRITLKYYLSILRRFVAVEFGHQSARLGGVAVGVVRVPLGLGPLPQRILPTPSVSHLCNTID